MEPLATLFTIFGVIFLLLVLGALLGSFFTVQTAEVAIVQRLGVSALRIGPQIDPGVPWTVSLGNPKLALALKSGNFGGPDFFTKALEMLS